MADSPRKLFAEALGTMLLLTVVIGSGIMAERSFANPAAAFGRMFSDSFAGIAPSSAPAFVIAELVGAGLAVAVNRVFVGAPVAPGAATATGEPRNV